MSTLNLALLITAFYCLLFRKTFLHYFVALELIILAINIELVITSSTLDTGNNIYLCFILLAVAAVDTAIGLGILLKYSQKNSDSQATSTIIYLTKLKG